MKKLLALCVVLIVLISTSAFAETAPQPLSAAEKIYSADFGSAKSQIDSFIAAHPADPNGYLLRGIYNEWYQLVENKGKSLNSMIAADYEKSRELAEALLQKNPESVDAKIMLANANIYISKKQIDTGHKMQAGSTLKKAKLMMEGVVAKDPNNMQAYFAIGLFNYFAANVPSGFQWLATLLGFKGDRGKGLDYIQKAASVSGITQGDARYMLVYIYDQKEHNYPVAKRFAAELLNKYSTNPVFLYNLAKQQIRIKELDESAQNFNKFLNQCSAKASGCDREYVYLTHFHLTWIYMIQGNYELAKKHQELAVELNTKRFKDRTACLEDWAQTLAKNPLPPAPAPMKCVL